MLRCNRLVWSLYFHNAFTYPQRHVRMEKTWRLLRNLATILTKEETFWDTEIENLGSAHVIFFFKIYPAIERKGCVEDNAKKKTQKNTFLDQ